MAKLRLFHAGLLADRLAAGCILRFTLHGPHRTLLAISRTAQTSYKKAPLLQAR